MNPSHHPEPHPTSTGQKRTISLTADQSHTINQRVASNGDISPNEVARTGLRTLKDRDAAIER